MLRATPRGRAAVGSALQVLRAGAASEAQRALIQRLEMMEQVEAATKILCFLFERDLSWGRLKSGYTIIYNDVEL